MIEESAETLTEMEYWWRRAIIAQQSGKNLKVTSSDISQMKELRRRPEFWLWRNERDKFLGVKVECING